MGMEMQTLSIATSVGQRGLKEINLEHYTGILLMHALARLALNGGSPGLDEVRGLLAPSVKGERRFKSNFPNYFCGGNATAYLLNQGLFPEAADIARKYAEEIMNDAPRSPDGILCNPSDPETHKIWIDVAFAVSPFLVYTGRALNEDRYMEEGFQQTAKMVNLLRDPANGLMNQGINFRAPGSRSQDHWSRGNGWGIHGLIELLQGLPPDHPRRPECERLFKELLDACLAFQDDEGMWHQEITRPDSYVETSGTGLILHALGVALELGIVPETLRAAFEKGLRGCLRYIALDGSVHHCCCGCLCPGDGTIEEFMAKPHPINDAHAFGPMVLLFDQAARLGIKQINTGDL
jgi:unsaturated rhamnogalacturonyl hydrolase